MHMKYFHFVQWKHFSTAFFVCVTFLSTSVLKELKGASKPPVGLEQASSIELNFSARHPLLPWQLLNSLVPVSSGGVCFVSFRSFSLLNQTAPAWSFCNAAVGWSQVEREQQEKKLFAQVGEELWIKQQGLLWSNLHFCQVELKWTFIYIYI